MATDAEIQEVQNKLSGTAGSEGWGEVRLGNELDAGKTPDEIALEYWEFKMARTSHLTNVSESGSSRSLGEIFKNASEMAKYYKDQVGEEEEETRSRPRTRSIRRV